MAISFLPPPFGNVFSPENSSETPLGANETFTGKFVRVNEFFDVSVYTDSDVASAFQGFQLQWSDDGVTEESPLRQSFGSGDKFADGRVRARFFRVVYINGSIAQTRFVLRTLLRRASSSGSVIRAGSDTPEFADAQVTHSVLTAPRLDDPSDLVHPRATGDPFLIVEHPPNRSLLAERNIGQSDAFSQQLDFFGIFGGSRRVLTIYNDTELGDLLIRFGSAASLTNWHVKVHPDCLWEMPQSWGNFSGGLFGIWNTPGVGVARVLELF